MFFSWTGFSLAGAQGKKVPTTITSDDMTYDPDSNRVSFSGEVHVARKDFQLWSEKLFIHFVGQQNRGSSSAVEGTDPGRDLSDVKKIIAVHNVRLESQGKKGFCGKATYFQDQDMLQMEDEPRLEDGKNQIMGEIIKLYIKDNRSEVIGGKKRVEAIFYSRPDQVE
ncbi:LptA/OstA family protein [Desulfoplanes sp.]